MSSEMKVLMPGDILSPRFSFTCDGKQINFNDIIIVIDVKYEHYRQGPEVTLLHTLHGIITWSSEWASYDSYLTYSVSHAK